MAASRPPADKVDENELERLLSAALERFETPVSESTELAKLAIEFRGLAVGVPIEPAKEFAGSRNLNSNRVDSAVFGDTQLCWDLSSDGLVGAVLPANRVDITLESPHGPIETVTSDEEGSFEFGHVLKGAHRLTVGEKEPWATPWFFATS